MLLFFILCSLFHKWTPASQPKEDIPKAKPRIFFFFFLGNKTQTQNKPEANPKNASLMFFSSTLFFYKKQFIRNLYPTQKNLPKIRNFLG